MLVVKTLVEQSDLHEGQLSVSYFQLSFSSLSYFFTWVSKEDWRATYRFQFWRIEGGIFGDTFCTHWRKFGFFLTRQEIILSTKSNGLCYLFIWFPRPWGRRREVLKVSKTKNSVMFRRRKRRRWVGQLGH